MRYVENQEHASIDRPAPASLRSEGITAAKSKSCRSRKASTCRRRQYVCVHEDSSWLDGCIVETTDLFIGYLFAACDRRVIPAQMLRGSLHKLRGTTDMRTIIV